MTILEKNLSFRGCQCGDDLELCHGACGGDGGAAQSREVVATGVGDALDQAKEPHAMWAQQHRWDDCVQR